MTQMTAQRSKDAAQSRQDAAKMTPEEGVLGGLGSLWVLLGVSYGRDWPQKGLGLHIKIIQAFVQLMIKTLELF